MIPMDLNWIASVLAVSFEGQNQQVLNINTDTRTIKAGEVFLAIKGPNFDGHKFVEQAVAQGAVAVIVDHSVKVQVPQFIVPDARLALGKLGAAVMAEVNPKTIAITGSVGKTTVKEMCAAILSQHGEVLATKGNFNNDIGVPLTLLRLEPKHQYAVIELGANHIGEIAYTTDLVKPDVAVVCNVAAAHIEGFGSLDGVAQAKGEIFSGLKTGGIAVINADSPYVDYWLTSLDKSTLCQFSMSQQLDVWPENIHLDKLGRAGFDLCTPTERIAVQLPIAGKHNITNALIACALTLPLGVTLAHVAQGLASMPMVQGRVNLIEVNDSLTVIDDTYNANVQSVKAGIDLLGQIEGHQIFAFGDMGELGADARQYHEEVGLYAQQKGIDTFYSLGVLSRYASDVYQKAGLHFSSRQQLLAAILNDIAHVEGPITILVKGSRSSRMELLVQDIVASAQHKNNNGAQPC
ncbi:UDP-N-acetylmuramoyl-tripeptide--D-alanyl-D-alanine ligase [Pseudoalteromonas tunicata]|uniref:UDP-N-acetylmuramoyl-tripeptide--D-alanyl-D- alanine ligase n=1 Tax=Pseudoalteromonas tunicata TaxID=314281 RepID=UPI00273FCBF7|nr:UDP-N-acetylmuramoyl-tripeptide--D-alanyl-D-alanine ligase [Pseudoalteromonas tunicata]MDP5213521.1 UDP-N-acetylmuramoyl-tripeptide--D-alanyl-D-alanine ligase [Pseudoalteromonas tunicata]